MLLEHAFEESDNAGVLCVFLSSSVRGSTNYALTIAIP